LGETEFHSADLEQRRVRAVAGYRRASPLLPPVLNTTFLTCGTICMNAVLRIHVNPGSRFLSIPDPKTATKERSEKKFVVLTISVAEKIKQN
jgi:hypothetical protein